MSEATQGEIPRPAGLLITAVATAGVLTATAIGAAYMLPEFRALYTGFGADVPPATMFLVKNPWICWLLALVAIGLAAWVIRRSVVARAELRWMQIAVYGYSACIGPAIAFAALALYWPIYKLGAAV